MKAVILAAGKGSRMGNFQDTPKCLLPFGESTLLERQLEILKSVGCDILVVGGFRHELIREIFPNVILNQDHETTDNALSLGIGLPWNEDVIVLDGDLVYDRQIIEEVLADKRENVVVTKKVQGVGDEGTGVSVSRSGRVVEIGKHVKTENLYLSIFKIGRKTVPFLKKELLKPKYRKNWYTVPLDQMLEKHFFYNLTTTHRWAEVDTRADYFHALNLFGVKVPKPTILVTGASGLLGERIYNILSKDYDKVVIGTQNASNLPHLLKLDITNEAEVKTLINRINPDIIIHAAAICDVDVCERNRKLATEVNIKGTKNIIEGCKDNKTKLIFISTDYVFNGRSREPYREDDPVNPLNFYGLTKAVGEKEVMKLDDYLIIRLPKFYGFSNRKETFVNEVLEKLMKDISFSLDNTQLRYPVLVDDVAESIKKVLYERGILHISSKVPVTKYNWGLKIADVFKLSRDAIHPDSSVNLNKRPLNSQLDTSKQDSLGLKIHDVNEGLVILKKQKTCVFRLLYKEQPEDEVFGIGVAPYRIALGELLAEEEPVKADMIVPIPESGIFLGIGYSKKSKIPYCQGLIRNSYVGRLLETSDKVTKIKLTRAKLIPVCSVLKGKEVVVVDEAIFTGTTLRVVADLLKACKVEAIHIRIGSPPILNICDAGLHPRGTLLNPTSAYFRVDSLKFLKLDKFLKTLPESDICTECLGSL